MAVRIVVRRLFVSVASALCLCSVAWRAAASPANLQQPAAEQKAAEPGAVPPDIADVLSGRITDENGGPVSDARISLVSADRNSNEETVSGRQGHYAFRQIKRPGEYRLLVYSTRCVGLTDFNNAPRVVLDPHQPLVRDFTLRLACRLRIQALDEQGRPVAKVEVFKTAYLGPFRSQTDAEGWATLGGMPSSAANEVFGIFSNKFAPAHFETMLNDPKTIVERKVVLKPGTRVTGIAVRSDGKPAAGWQITALPTWWSTGTFPPAQTIEADGSFVLPHVGAGPHNVAVFIPIDERNRAIRRPLAGIDLAHHQGPLKITIDYVPRGPATAFAGKLRFVGGRPKQSYFISAQSADRRLGAMQLLQPTDESFQFGKLAPGRYQIRFQSREIEPDESLFVDLPAKDYQLTVKLRKPFVLRGVVVRGSETGRGDGRPTAFRVRVVKLRALHGVNNNWAYSWHTVSDQQGGFTEEVFDPGIYAIEATADGFSTSLSEPLSTDQLPQAPVRLTLSTGISLSGTIVDEAGRPIDGATVISLRSVSTLQSLSFAEIPGGIGVKTVAGRFQLDRLSAGRDTLRIVHPDYAPVEKSVLITATEPPAPLKIVMQPGGTVRGHVQDSQGRLLAGVSLIFQSYLYGSDSETGRYATAITDENGYYEVQHLPEQIVYVHRPEEWEAQGIVRQAILPANGKTRTLDFGGSSQVEGRLVVNGKPLAQTRVLLAGDNPSSSPLRASAETDADGKFSFAGVPVGERYLYYAIDKQFVHWVRVRPLRIDSTRRNFGTIDYSDGRFTINLRGSADQNSPASATLAYTEPAALRGRNAGYAAPHREPRDPFVFEHVAAGKYRASATIGDGIRVSRLVERAANVPDQTITLEVPLGTATLRCTLDPGLRQGTIWNRIRLNSHDERLSRDLAIKHDGRFETAQLPAGHYTLLLERQLPNSTSTEAVVTECSLQDGETRTLALTPKNMQPPTSQQGFASVYVFTADGLPLPGAAIKLTGSGGPLAPTYINSDGRTLFEGPPGIYKLSVEFPGFKQVRVQIELRVPDRQGKIIWDAMRRIELAPIE